MKRGSKNSSGNEYKKVIDSVRDYIFQTHRLPQVTTIAKLTDIAESRCRDICKQLIGQNQLYEAFGGPRLPTVILPYDMMQAILRIQSKPNWINKYSFEQKTKIDIEIEKLQTKVVEYEMFERLLYTTDIPLEKAVSFTLDWLGFQDVRHFDEDKDNPDVTFIYKGIKALIETEGTIKAGDKNKAQQLEGWLRKEINSGMKARGLKGFFVVNHFREMEPESRGDPLTSYAKEYLKLYHCNFFTTYFLFKVIKAVMAGSISREDAQNKVWEGEKID